MIEALQAFNESEGVWFRSKGGIAERTQLKRAGRPSKRFGSFVWGPAEMKNKQRSKEKARIGLCLKIVFKTIDYCSVLSFRQFFCEGSAKPM